MAVTEGQERSAPLRATEVHSRSPASLRPASAAQALRARSDPQQEKSSSNVFRSAPRRSTRADDVTIPLGPVFPSITTCVPYSCMQLVIVHRMLRASVPARLPARGDSSCLLRSAKQRPCLLSFGRELQLIELRPTGRIVERKCGGALCIDGAAAEVLIGAAERARARVEKRRVE